jgi:hypothetical protein
MAELKPKTNLIVANLVSAVLGAGLMALGTTTGIVDLKGDTIAVSSADYAAPVAQKREIVETVKTPDVVDETGAVVSWKDSVVTCTINPSQRFNPLDYFVPDGDTAIVRVIIPWGDTTHTIDYPLAAPDLPDGYGSRLDVVARLVPDPLTTGYVALQAQAIDAGKIEIDAGLEPVKSGIEGLNE